MSDPNDQPGPEPQLRGEAAWKHQKDAIDRRNAEAKKAGKAQREAHEREQISRRNVRDATEMARFMKGQPK
jgi:hypothetical protein